MLKHKAVLAELSGDFKPCEKLVDEALEFIRESSQLGKSAAIYGDCLMVKVMLLTDTDRFDEAIEIYEDARQIVEIARGAAHPRMLELLEALLVLAERKGLDKEAAALQEQAKAIKELLANRENC